MEEEYLDQNFSIQNFVQSLNIDINQKETLEPFLDNFQHLSIVQSSLLNLLQNQKNKIMIESTLKNGKTMSLFFHMIQSICQFENSDKKNSPIYVLTYPHKVFFNSIKETLVKLNEFFKIMPVDLIVLEDAELNIISNQKGNTIRIIIGTVLDVINCFRKENLQANQLESLIIDDLDQLLSFGQFNNIRRFINFWKAKSNIENKNLIITLKEDCFTQIQTFKELIDQKFVNIRIKVDLKEELQNYQQETQQENTAADQTLYNQYFYISQTENLYSLLFLIAKFEVFSQNFLVISDTIEQAYANKLFLERMSLAKNVVVYNPQHPVALKSYKVSLFNNNTTKFLCAPKNFISDIQSNKDIKQINNFRNIVFANCKLTKKEFLNYRKLVLDQLSLKHLDRIGDYNFLFLIKEGDNNLQHYQQDEEIESSQQKSFYELLEELRQENLNADFQPMPIDNKDISLFNYRTQQVLGTLSKNCIKLYRLIEIKKLMLKSKKMKEYFKTNSKEKNLILHQLNKYCKQFEKTKISISDHIPEYLKPTFVKEQEQLNKVQYLMKKNKLQRPQISRRQLQRENPLITEPQRLKTFSSHKLWKIKHKKIKKRPNKKLIRKGVYNANQQFKFDNAKLIQEFINQIQIYCLKNRIFDIKKFLTMENLVCPKCKLHYDFQEKQPRLFPNCGHTFCQECILNLLKKKRKKYSCPKDNIKCDPSVIEKGLDYFPINLAIKNFIQPEEQSESEEISSQEEESQQNDQDEQDSLIDQENDSSIDEFSQQNFCIHHHKKAELVCLTDRKVICSECVMFGIHKTHDYLKPEFFKQKALKDLYDLREKAESMNPNQLSEQMIEQEKNHLISKVKYKKDMLQKEIEKNFENLLLTIESKKKELTEELDSHFGKFENSINYINSNLVQILAQENELFQTFKNLENEIQKKFPDLNKLLDMLYGECSLLKSSQEISQKRNQQTSNTKKLIYENLNKIQLKGNFKKLIDEIRIDVSLETKSKQEEKQSFIERKNSFMDRKEKTKSFDKDFLHDKKNSLIENVLQLNQLEDNLYNDFELPQNQNQTPIKNQDSIISDVLREEEQEASLNIQDDKEEEHNILESSIIDNSLLIQEQNKHHDEHGNFLKNHEGGKSFRKLSSMGRQNSNKLYQRKLSRKFFQPNVEQKIMTVNDNNQQNYTSQRRQSREMNNTYTQSNTGFYNNSLYGSKQNFTQNSMMMTSEANVSKVTQKQIRSNTQKKFGHQSQRNFYNGSNNQPRIIKRDFSNRGISEADIDIYLRDVLDDPYVRILDLSNNNITLKGFKYLIQKLSKNTCIEFLDLKNNKIDDKAFIILEKYGKNLTSLKKISLQKNKITSSLSNKKMYLDKLKRKGIKVNLIL